jgi:ectoine hydroxylase-related dioxygenase (phytanoyl-CoA dioxygenase family)
MFGAVFTARKPRGPAASYGRGMEPAVHPASQLDALTMFFRANGYVVVRGLYTDTGLDAIEQECVALQAALVRGELPEGCGTATLVDDGVATPVAHYVCNLTTVAPLARLAATDAWLEAAMGRVLGPGRWLLEDDRFGVVYQDARPGKDSAYTRIGWHSDWQSGPHLDCWPSVAFTIHLDATSPANGFLRVVPGSHWWATPAPVADIYGKPAPVGPGVVGGHSATAPPFPMPPGFEKIAGEVAVYCDRGDVILHDAYLWHSAARATDDDTVRRHIRGSYYAGQSMGGSGLDDFVKNARR